jgi:hypothetical protein
MKRPVRSSLVLPFPRAITLMALVVVGIAGLPRAALAKPGGRVWARRQSGYQGGFADARAVVVSPDGSKVFVAGGIAAKPNPPVANFNFATIAYDATTGNRLWLREFDGNLHRSDDALAMAISPDGSTVFVTGRSDAAVSHVDYLTVAYDATTGAKRWVARLKGPANGDDVPRAIGVSPDGTEVFVTGSIDGGAPTQSDFGTVAYDASTGGLLWLENYDSAIHSVDNASALGVSADGSRVFVTGTSRTPDGDRFLTIAYDTSNGSPNWIRRYTAGHHGTATALGVSPDGSSVVVSGVGFGNGSTSSDDFATVAYDASTGTQRWSRRYDDPIGSSDRATAIGVTSTRVFVTGQGATDAGVGSYATVAYDLGTGAAQWVRTFTGPADAASTPNALTTSPNGSSVYVTGQSFDAQIGGFYDYETVAYDASTGATEWVNGYDGNADKDDIAYAIAVSPDGSRVFVTGDSTNPSGSTAMTTLALSTT